MTNSEFTDVQQQQQEEEVIPIIMDIKKSRFPYCIVWTPIPFFTWFLPFLGHMGIAYSNGKIRDFAGSKFVSEDQMAFGKPTKYWKLNSEFAQRGTQGFDHGIYLASEEYKGHYHNIFCDNCHSHVAMALNMMEYKRSTSWNMVWLALYMIIFGRYVNFVGFLKTWIPTAIIYSIIIIICVAV